MSIVNFFFFGITSLSISTLCFGGRFEDLEPAPKLEEKIPRPYGSPEPNHEEPRLPKKANQVTKPTSPVHTGPLECPKKKIFTSGVTLGVGNRDVTVTSDNEGVDTFNKMIFPQAQAFFLWREACRSYDESWLVETLAEYARVEKATDLSTPAEMRFYAGAKLYNFIAPDPKNCQTFCFRASPFAGVEWNRMYIVSLPQYTIESVKKGLSKEYAIYQYSTTWLVTGVAIPFYGWPAIWSVIPDIGWALSIKAKKLSGSTSPTPAQASRVRVSLRNNIGSHVYIDYSGGYESFFRNITVKNTYYTINFGFFF